MVFFFFFFFICFTEIAEMRKWFGSVGQKFLFDCTFFFLLLCLVILTAISSILSIRKMGNKNVYSSFPMSLRWNVIRCTEKWSHTKTHSYKMGFVGYSFKIITLSLFLISYRPLILLFSKIPRWVQIFWFLRTYYAIFSTRQSKSTNSRRILPSYLKEIGDALLTRKIKIEKSLKKYGKHNHRNLNRSFFFPYSCHKMFTLFIARLFHWKLLLNWA